MKLSDGEKLILMMLADMYKHLKIKNPEFNPDFITATISHDHLWGFNWQYSGIPFQREELPREVKETADILDMWRFLEHGYNDLPTAEKAKVQKATGLKDVKFIGFDGNNENHYGIALYFVEHLKPSFEHFKGRDLNSHMASIDRYRNMYRVFEQMRTTLDRSPNADQIVEILNGRQ
jgi:uncharacterized protein YfbU (UPF0304 family)